MNSKQRRQKRRKYIRDVEIRIQEDEFDGVFTSDQYINNSGFVDFLFIGTYKGKKVIWNACMSTADGDYFDKVSDICLDEAHNKYPEPEGYEAFKAIPVDGKNSLSIIVNDPNFPDEPRRRKERYKFHAQETIKMLDSQTVSLKSWNVEIDESYRFGVGLHIRIDVPFINKQDVIDFVNAFDGSENTYSNKAHLTTSKTAKELNVCLSESGEHVVWINRSNPNFAALKI